MLPSIAAFGGTWLLKSVYSDALVHAAVPLSIQYHLPITLAFGRGAVAKPSINRGLWLQYRLLITLAFKRGAGAKLSRRFPLQYDRSFALSFKRGALAILSRHEQAHRLTGRRLGCVDSHYVSPFESEFGLTTYGE